MSVTPPRPSAGSRLAPFVAAALFSAALSSPPALAALACGDGLLGEGETCEACPADCKPASCVAGAARQRVRITFSTPMGAKVTAATVRLTYRSDVVRLPRDQGDAAVRKRITPRQQPNALSANDEGYGVRLVVVRGDGLAPGPLAEIEFDRCAGARLPTAADLGCTVEGCAGGGGALPHCSCRAETL